MPIFFLNWMKFLNIYNKGDSKSLLKKIYMFEERQRSDWNYYSMILQKTQKITEQMAWNRRRLRTLPGSLIEPFPLMYTRQPVEASTRFSELPRGPRSRPTKLNCCHINLSINKYWMQPEMLSKWWGIYVWICIHWDFQAQDLLDDVRARTGWRALPIHRHSPRSTKSLFK